MIRTLKRKFIFTAMAAITLLLILLLGAINTINILSIRKDTSRALSIISSSEGNFHKLPLDPTIQDTPDELKNPPMEKPKKESFIPKKNTQDTFMSSNFFVVQTDADGDVIFTDVSRTSSISSEDASMLASQVLLSGSTDGKIESYRYQVSQTPDTSEKTLVFLDVSGEVGSYLRVLLVSAAIGLICWVCMLLLVTLLAEKAILPIAENIEKQKQFITDAGHELKTPLAIILSNTEAMELIKGENKWSRNIKEQTLRLSDLMQNLLLLARMEENPSVSQKEDLLLDQLTEEVVESFHQSLELAEIRLSTNLEKEVRWHGNKQTYVQILSILVDNAVKYTNTGGNLQISLAQTASTIQLQAENSCDALPDADPEKLFDRFYRGDKSRSGKSGYGIGLAAARSLARNAKGSIHAEYIGDNRIRFTLSLPKK